MKDDTAIRAFDLVGLEVAKNRIRDRKSTEIANKVLQQATKSDKFLIALVANPGSGAVYAHSSDGPARQKLGAIFDIIDRNEAAFPYIKHVDRAFRLREKPKELTSATR